MQSGPLVQHRTDIVHLHLLQAAADLQTDLPRQRRHLAPALLAVHDGQREASVLDQRQGEDPQRGDEPRAAAEAREERLQHGAAARHQEDFGRSRTTGKISKNRLWNSTWR